MGKAQREKGKRGEREVRSLFMAHGFKAERYAPVQAGSVAEPDVKVALKNGHELHVEVKRRENLPSYIKEFVYGHKNFLRATFVREDYGEWLVVLPANVFIALLEAWEAQNDT